MNDYMLMFRGGNPRDAQLSPQQLEEHMKSWGAWVAGLHAKGIFKTGESLRPDGARCLDPRLVVTDGPFSEAKELIGGFVILSAADVDAATELAKGCPVLKTGGTIEIRELFPTPAG